MDERLWFNLDSEALDLDDEVLDGLGELGIRFSAELIVGLF